MVRGFAAALEDPQILVQRGILDLLTTTLKLDGVAFKRCAQRTPEVQILALILRTEQHEARRPDPPHARRDRRRLAKGPVSQSAALHLAPRLIRQLRSSNRSPEGAWPRPPPPGAQGAPPAAPSGGSPADQLARQLEMDAQSTDTVDRQRPFKIFISLLDKWEIGGPLTEVLVLDAFAALQTSLRPNDDHDEVCAPSVSLATPSDLIVIGSSS